MKSEIDEIWAMLTSDDDQIQTMGLFKYNDYFQKYPYFERIKEYLPKRFYEIYKKTNFHDFHVLDIVYNSRPSRKTEIKMLIYDYHENYGKNLCFHIIYRDVKEYQFVVKTTKHNMTWGRDVFEPIDNGMLKHRILCCDGTSIEISFKSISVVRLKRPPVIGNRKS